MQLQTEKSEMEIHLQKCQKQWHASLWVSYHGVETRVRTQHTSKQKAKRHACRLACLWYQQQLEQSARTRDECTRIEYTRPEYSSHYVAWLHRLECKLSIGEWDLSTYGVAFLRIKALDTLEWILHRTHDVSHRLFALSVAYMEEYLRRTERKISLVEIAVTCLWIASKFEENDLGDAPDFLQFCERDLLSSRSLLLLEKHILNVLDCRCWKPIAHDFVHQVFRPDPSTAQHLNLLCDVFLFLTHSYECPPSLVAAAVLSVWTNDSQTWAHTFSYPREKVERGAYLLREIFYEVKKRAQKGLLQRSWLERIDRFPFQLCNFF